MQTIKSFHLLHIDGNSDANESMDLNTSEALRRCAIGESHNCLVLYSCGIKVVLPEYIKLNNITSLLKVEKITQEEIDLHFKYLKEVSYGNISIPLFANPTLLGLSEIEKLEVRDIINSLLNQGEFSHKHSIVKKSISDQVITVTITPENIVLINNLLKNNSLKFIQSYIKLNDLIDNKTTIINIILAEVCRFKRDVRNSIYLSELASAIVHKLFTSSNVKLQKIIDQYGLNTEQLNSFYGEGEAHNLLLKHSSSVAEVLNYILYSLSPKYKLKIGDVSIPV